MKPIFDESGLKNTETGHDRYQKMDRITQRRISGGGNIKLTLRG
jgi:hypothetical protein